MPLGGHLLQLATALSGRALARTFTNQRFQALARRSLLLGVLSMPTSCLVEDPPAYVAPKQTPPFLDYRRAEPGLDQVFVATVKDTISFRIPVVSEDAGVPLAGIMLLDYSGGVDTGLGFPLPPSTLDDKSRVFQIDWPISKQTSSGCHRFTLRATHTPNVDIANYPELLDPSDSAEAYWWANVINPDDDETVDPDLNGTLRKCPTASGGVTGAAP